MTAAIIGGGVIGSGWAARFLLNGWDVAVFDPGIDPERRVNAVVDNARHSLPALYDCALPAEGVLTFCDTIAAAVAGADWIQESVPERLDLKHEVFGEIQRHAPKHAVLARTEEERPRRRQDDRRPRTQPDAAGGRPRHPAGHGVAPDSAELDRLQRSHERSALSGRLRAGHRPDHGVDRRRCRLCRRGQELLHRGDPSPVPGRGPRRRPGPRDDAAPGRGWQEVAPLSTGWKTAQAASPLPENICWYMST